MDQLEAIDLSFVIPAFNAGLTLGELVNNINSNSKLKIQIIIVDDFSQDDTAEILTKLSEKYSNVNAIFLNENVGAGEARNIGFNHCIGNCTIFFDADDIPIMSEIENLYFQLIESSCDVAIGAYNSALDYKSSGNYLNTNDIKIWNYIIKENNNKIFRLKNHASILTITNYPWNKICLTDYLRRINLKFSNTKVHNDISAHWQILLNSNSIFLSKNVVCKHVVGNSKSHITNISDGRRLELFRALQEVDEYFDNRLSLREIYYIHFLKLKIILFNWNASKIDYDYRFEFIENVKLSLKGVRYEDYLFMKNNMPIHAEKLLEWKFRTSRKIK